MSGGGGGGWDWQANCVSALVFVSICSLLLRYVPSSTRYIAALRLSVFLTRDWQFTLVIHNIITSDHSSSYNDQFFAFDSCLTLVHANIVSIVGAASSTTKF